MKIFIIINNINDFIFQSLKYWIYEQSTKWMIKFNKNDNLEIVLIITIHNYFIFGGNIFHVNNPNDWKTQRPAAAAKPPEPVLRNAAHRPRCGIQRTLQTQTTCSGNPLPAPL